jgi:hypothetical protein
MRTGARKREETDKILRAHRETIPDQDTPFEILFTIHGKDSEKSIRLTGEYVLMVMQSS